MININNDIKIIRKVALVRLRPNAFEKYPHPIGVRIPYILKYIESLLNKEGICIVKLFDQLITKDSYEDTLRRINEFCPDLAVVSISTLDIDLSLAACRLLKEKGSVIFGVGQEVSSNIERFTLMDKHFDLLLPGEAEVEAVSIIRKLNNGVNLLTIKDCYRDQQRIKPALLLVEDLDNLPFPQYDFNSLKAYVYVYPLRINKKLIWGNVLTSRGCPHNCFFCSPVTRESYGRKFRARSAANVSDEIEYLLKLGANIINFTDDNFTGSTEHVRAVCNEIKKRNLQVKWIAHARIDEITPGLMKLMKEAGCILLRFGIESGSERILKTLSKAQDPGWFKKCREVMAYAHYLDIPVACLFIVGAPQETKDDFFKSVELAKELSPDIIQVANFMPFPGSAAHRLFIDRIKDIPSSGMYQYGSPLINLSAMSDKELKNAQMDFYIKFLLRPLFIVRHIIRYLPFYFHNPGIFLKLTGLFKGAFGNKK